MLFEPSGEKETLGNWTNPTSKLSEYDFNPNDVIQFRKINEGTLLPPIFFFKKNSNYDGRETESERTAKLRSRSISKLRSSSRSKLRSSSRSKLRSRLRSRFRFCF